MRTRQLLPPSKAHVKDKMGWISIFPAGQWPTTPNGNVRSFARPSSSHPPLSAFGPSSRSRMGSRLPRRSHRRRNARPGISNSRAFRASDHCSKTSSTACGGISSRCAGSRSRCAARAISCGESTAWIRSLMPRRSTANPGCVLFLRCHSPALLPSAPFLQSGSGCRAFRRRTRRRR